MSSQITAIDLTSAVTTYGGPNCPQVGAVYEFQGKKFVFVKGNATVAQYSYVSILQDGTFTANPLTTTTNPTTAPGLVGCVQFVTGLTSTNWGWVQVKGAHTGAVSAATAVSVKMYTTATAGSVSSTSSSSTLVNGLTAVVSTSGAGTTSMYADLDMTTVSA